jgi:hypothetical protein
VHDFFDINRPLYFVIEEFDLAAHALKMGLNPKLTSERQRRCLLYWQQPVRARLESKVQDFMVEKHLNAYTTCPEGMGVNVFVTARLAGLKLDKTRNISTSHHIALVGYKKA